MPDPAARARAAAAARERAGAEYRAAVLALVESLEADGARDVFARAAAAVGVRRQSVRELVLRARGIF